MFRLVVYDRHGSAIGELERATNVSRSFLLSRSTQLTFELSRTDPKCNPLLLRMNNVVVVWSDKWPPWSGFISNRTWSEDTVSVTCDSIENRLQKRLTTLYEELEDELAGDIFTMLLNDANAPEATGLVAGEVFNGGQGLSMSVMREVVYDKIVELTDLSKMEWRVLMIQPGAWQMDFLEHIGADKTGTVVVMQGVDMEGAPDLQEDGLEYANSVIAVGYDEELEEDEQPEAEYTDWDSVAQEGLHQVVVQFETAWEEGALLELARKEVSKRRTPMRTLSFSLNNNRALWGTFDVGDYICVVLPYYGFSGMVVPIRVNGIEVNEDSDVAAITGDVIAGEEAAALTMFKNAKWGFSEAYLYQTTNQT